jgi:lysophospholipase L1-like esterase
MNAPEQDLRGGDPADGTDPRPVVAGPMLRRLCVVLVGVLIGIALVDRGVAWWDADEGAGEDERAIVEHEWLVWTGRPHFENPKYETVLDRFGNRSAEIPMDAPLDELRVAGFGASQIYGAGGAKQSDVWHVELERLLDEASPRPVRVINGGVMAYSGLQAARRAGMLLDTLEPDFVFVVVGTGAQSLLDPSSGRKFTRFGDGANDVLPQDIGDAWPKPVLPLVASTHRFLSDWSAIYRRHRAQFKNAGGVRTADVQRWILSRAEQPAGVQRLIDATIEELVALDALCDARGVELRVIVLAEPETDTQKGWDEYLVDARRVGAPPTGTPRDEPTDLLEERLTARGLAVWNFFDEVASMGPQRAAHTMPDRQHWNARGHAVFARGVMKRLREERLIGELAARRAASPREHAFGPSPFAAD